MIPFSVLIALAGASSQVLARPGGPSLGWESPENACAKRLLREKLLGKKGYNRFEDSFAFLNWANPGGTANCWGWSSIQRKFFYFAAFDSKLPRLSSRIAYEERIDRISKGELVVIPGYANLNAFSRDYAVALKKVIHLEWIGKTVSAGPTLLGHVFGAQMGISRSEVASALIESLGRGIMPLLAFFGRVSDNHVVMVTSYSRNADGSVVFFASDSNEPDVKREIYFSPKDGGSLTMPGGLDESDDDGDYPQYSGPRTTSAIVGTEAEILYPYKELCRKTAFSWQEE